MAWTPSTGTDLYAMIDEATPDDADYIRSSAAPDDESAVVVLSAITTPQPGTVTLRVRAKYV